jgi:hypothetical protein
VLLVVTLATRVELNVMFSACRAGNPVPEAVTLVPTGPDVGDIEIVGVAADAASEGTRSVATATSRARIDSAARSRNIQGALSFHC